MLGLLPGRQGPCTRCKPSAVPNPICGAAGLANAYEGLWDSVSDALLDERPFVVGLAASAVAQLLAWGSGDAAAASAFSGAAGGEDGPAADATAAATAAIATSAGFMMCRVADRASQRLAAALGPVLEMCSLVPAAGQVAVCDLLLALVQRVLAQVLRAAAGDATALPPPPTGVPVPNLATLVSSAAAYLASLQQAGDAAARTEACGAVLSLAADLAAAGPPAAAAAAGLPAAQVLDAVQALLALKEREYMEAGLADMCEVVVAALPALLVRRWGLRVGAGGATGTWRVCRGLHCIRPTSARCDASTKVTGRCQLGMVSRECLLCQQ